MGIRSVLTLDVCDLKTTVICDKCGEKEVLITTNNDTNIEKTILAIIKGETYIACNTFTYYFKRNCSGRKKVTFKEGEPLNLHDYSEVMQDIYATETYADKQFRLQKVATKTINESNRWFLIPKDYSIFKKMIRWFLPKYMFVCKDCAEKYQSQGGEVQRIDDRPGPGKLVDKHGLPFYEEERFN